jgi:hypothetical protein
MYEHRHPKKPSSPPPHNQLGWSLVGWFNLIAVAIVVVAIWGPPLTLWWILGGTVVAFAVPVLFFWRGLKK